MAEPKRRALSPEQTAVVCAADRRFTVRASAGSGKTTVLVERYLRHVVEDGLSPDQILTVTFTRRAAAMMKERIVRRLREEGRHEDAQVAETGPIQTIHGFCERLLRENAIAGGIDAGFEVLSEGQAAAAIDAAIRHALATEPEASPEAARLLVAQATLFDGDGGGTLRRVIEQALGQFRSGGRDRHELEGAYASPASVRDLWMRLCLDDLPSDVRQIVLHEPSNWPEGVREITRQAGYTPPKWLRATTSAVEAGEADATVGLARFVLAAWRFLEDSMLRDQRFDFAFMESMAVRLVETCGPVRARLARQYQAALIDEAQDVNPVQYRLLDSIAVGRSMMVGDPQQSIYRFRFADRDLFVQRTHETPCYDLARNYRSSPGILRFVDRVFSRVWAEDYRRMAPELAASDDPFQSDSDATGVELWPMDGKDSGLVALHVEDLVVDQGGPEGIAVLFQRNDELSRVAEMLAKRQVRCRKVGGSDKFFAKMEVRDLANALDAASDPTRDFAMLALLRSPFVGLSYDSLALLAAEGQVYEALSDFKPADAADAERVEAFRRWFDPLAARAPRVPAWESLGPLLDSTPYLATVCRQRDGRQALANVRKLLAMAVAEPESGAHEFAERIRQVQRLGHKEGDAPAIDEQEPAVVLTTVHRAKGLEFPVVVLADTFTKFAPKGPSDLACDGRTGQMASRFNRIDTLAFACLGARSASEQEAEAKRSLYVAMTRAERRLCLVCSEQANQESPAGLISLTAGYPRSLAPGVYVRQGPDRPQVNFP